MKEKLIKKISHKESDEKFWLISGLASLPILLGSSIYLIHLRSIYVIKSDTVLVLYIFYMGLATIITSFGIYEILASRKTRKPNKLYLKRFLFRSFLMAAYWMFILTFWHILTLTTYISWRHSLLLSGFLASLILAVAIKLSKIRDFIKGSENG